MHKSLKVISSRVKLLSLASEVLHMTMDTVLVVMGRDMTHSPLENRQKSGWRSCLYNIWPRRYPFENFSVKVGSATTTNAAILMTQQGIATTFPLTYLGLQMDLLIQPPTQYISHPPLLSLAMFLYTRWPFFTNSCYWQHGHNYLRGRWIEPLPLIIVCS